MSLYYLKKINRSLSNYGGQARRKEGKDKSNQTLYIWYESDNGQFDL